MSQYWKCPNCGTVLEKGLSGMFGPGTMIVGTATCGACGAKFAQSEVYGGKYDVSSASGASRPSTRRYGSPRKKWWQFWR